MVTTKASSNARRSGGNDLDQPSLFTDVSKLSEPSVLATLRKDAAHPQAYPNVEQSKTNLDVQQSESPTSICTPTSPPSSASPHQPRSAAEKIFACPKNIDITALTKLKNTLNENELADLAESINCSDHTKTKSIAKSNQTPVSETVDTGNELFVSSDSEQKDIHICDPEHGSNSTMTISPKRKNDTPQNEGSNAKKCKQSANLTKNDTISPIWTPPKKNGKTTEKAPAGQQEATVSTLRPQGSIERRTSTKFMSDIWRDTVSIEHLTSRPICSPANNHKEAPSSSADSTYLEDEEAVKQDKKVLEDYLKSSGFRTTPTDDGKWSIRGMKTSLMAHQVLGAGFMTDRENQPSEPKGGILADEMGLGKTVTTLACIVHGNSKLYDSPHISPSTLIVARSTLVSQWFSEIQKHCHVQDKKQDFGVFGVFGVLQYHARSRVQTTDLAEVLVRHNIILTTYDEVLRSHSIANASGKDFDLDRRNGAILHCIKFHRVVLDEAHQIRNYKSRVSLACRALCADHYWAVTGTPLINTPNELFSYVSFIRDPCAKTYQLFSKKFLETPKAKEEQRDLLRKLMLRRTYRETLLGARLVELPQATELTHYLEFNSIEREVYELTRKDYGKRLKRIVGKIEPLKKRGDILVMLVKLRQLCAHVFLGQEEILRHFQAEKTGELRRRAQHEGCLQSTGASLLVSLRKTLSLDAQSIETEEALVKSMAESETGPFDVLDVKDIQHLCGKSHGLTFQFVRYLNTLPNQVQEINAVKSHQCSKCREPPVRPHITDCMHIYCSDCLRDMESCSKELGRNFVECSACGTRYTNTKPCATSEETELDHETFPASANFFTSSPMVSKTTKKRLRDANNWINMPGNVLPSAKTIGAKAQILEWKKEEPKVKIIIFTQWIPMIAILAKVCETEGWGYCKYTGDMAIRARDKAVADFGSKDNKTIMLISLQAGGLGLNLTMATKAIILDPWWNSAIEDQAFSRIFRIGQTKKTRVVHFLIKDSIESAMQNLKVRKQVVINKLLDAHETEDGLDMNDLLVLLRLVGESGTDDEGGPVQIS